MKLTAKQLQRLLRYLGVGLLAYLLFLYLTFPGNLIKDRVLSEVERAFGTGVRARDMSIGLIGGVQLNGVELDLPRGPIQLDRLQVRPRLLSLLIGRRSASFLARVRQSEVGGSVSQRRETIELELQLKKVELPLVLGLLGQKDLNLTGSANGQLTLAGPSREIPAGNLSHAKGQLTLNIPKPVLEASTITLPQNPMFGPMSGVPLALPRTAFQDFGLNLSLSQGAAKVNKLALKGDDLSANVGGTLQLASLLPLSQLQLNVELNVGSKYRPQLDTFKGLLPTSMKVDGGKISFNVGGSLQQPFLRD